MELKVIDKREILEQEITTYGDLDNPIFLAKDVANWIEHTDLSRMVNLVDEDEKLKRTLYVSGQRREMWFLTEDGLYELLMQSRKPIAKQFKKQVKKMLKELRLKTNPYLSLSKELQAILTIDKKQQLMEEDIIEVKEDLQGFKEEIPLFTVECEEVTRLVRKVGTEALKGKNSISYKNKSLRSKVYSDIYRQLRREFGVTSYKAIKRRQLEQALQAVENYRLPMFLEEEINLINKYGSRGDLVC
ncbi:ORF6C domain-containing protein (plasmid) [Paraclostridium bifermentans]|uniref:ORF6C domain-containing protein n=1 Tax=Paraclostridium bifermentans TaxID=1490 RepID=A0ABY8R9Y1_PARBF|nr:ORF6C domain-containing protein [Paraclostridium bifermentans]